MSSVDSSSSVPLAILRGGNRVPTFSGLAAVEVQLVMHFLDARSRFRLARCGRQTWAASSAPFAWRHCPPVAVRSDLQPPAPTMASRAWRSIRRAICCAPSDFTHPLRSQLDRSLLGCAANPKTQTPAELHADLLLRWVGNDDSSPGGVFPGWDAERVSAMLRLLHELGPRLLALDLSDRRLTRCPFAELLPSLPGLTALDITGLVLDELRMPDLMASLPLLRTLRCYPNTDGWHRMAPLARLPHLTDLSIDAFLLHLSADDLQVLDGCPGLRRLSIIGMDATTCPLLLRDPNLRGLCELRLAHVLSPLGRPPLPWGPGLSNLRSLRRLTLDRCKGVNTILAALLDDGSCPELRNLRIAPAVLKDSNSVQAAFDADRDSRNPSVEALSQLLWRRSQVRVELRLGFWLAGVSMSWLLPPMLPVHSDRFWYLAGPDWTVPGTNVEPLCPLRHQFRQRGRYITAADGRLCAEPILFADCELGRETPL